MDYAFSSGFDFTSYYAARIPEVIAVPLVGCSILAATLVPFVPRWVRQELTAVYLVVLLPFALSYGLNFAPVYLAEQVTGGMLALFGLLFAGIRSRWHETRLSGVVFVLAYLATALLILKDLVRHWEINAS